MHKIIIVLTMILYITNVSTLVDTNRILPENHIEITIEKTITHQGALCPEQELIRHAVMESEIGNIPLRTQTEYSCGTTAIAMVADWLNQPYRDQTFYDACADRNKGEHTRLYQLQVCGYQLKMKSDIEKYYDTKYLKRGDIVLYHVYEYDTDFDLHYSVVDSIDAETIRLANPHGMYQEYSITDFQKIYTKNALIILP